MKEFCVCSETLNWLDCRIWGYSSPPQIIHQIRTLSLGGQFSGLLLSAVVSQHWVLDEVF